MLENENKMDTLVFQINLIEALYEIQQSTKAYLLLKNVINAIGFTPRVAVCYRRVIENLLLEKKINEVLFVKNHNIRFDDKDEAIFTYYLSYTQENEPHLWKIGELPTEHILSHFDKTKQYDESGLDSNPPGDDGLLRLVSSIEEKPFEVIEKITRLLKKDSNNPRFLFALGLAYRQIKDFSKSYTPINLALEIWPDEYTWQEIAADLCEKVGDNLNAARHRNLIEKYSGLNRQSRVNNYQYFQQLISDCVFGEKDIPKRDLSALLNYADDLVRWNSEEIAGGIVSRILEVNPKNLRARILKIEILLKQGDFSKAKTLISQLLIDHPDELKVLELHVRFLLATNELQDASHLIAKIKNDKGFLEGDLLLLNSEIIEKETDLDTALSFVKEQLEKSNDLILIQHAVSYLIQNKDFLTSQKYIDRLLQMDSNDTESLFIAGKLAEALGDLDKALDYYNRAITINPYVSKIYIACAELYETRRQFDLSKKSLEEGIQHNLNDFTLLKYTGNYFEKIGKEEDVIKCYRRAYTINKYDKDLEKALELREE